MRAVAGALLGPAFGIFWCPATPAAAAAQVQEYVLQGQVRDAGSGAGLAGAHVTLRDTEIAAMTDAAGSYTLRARVAAGTYTVEAALIGRETQAVEVTLAGQSTVRVPDLRLRTRALELESVIVTGTAAPTARRALGNAVSTVDGERLAQSSATTIDQALQGKVAGAVIQSNTGTPGGGVSVRLRGTSSIVAGAEPLYIVDGVVIDNNGDQQINFGYRSNPSNRLADLDPNDIERIEILKGAAAAALYGSRANNGVVQIFTKRGAAGATRFTAGTQITSSRLERRIPFALTPIDLDGETVTRYDHQDILFRSGLSYDAYLSASGGSEDTRFYISGNWVDQEGIMRGSGNDRLSVRMNLDQRATPWLDLSLGTSYIRNHSDLVINGEQGFGGLLTAIVFTPTTLDLTERDPTTGELVNQGIFPNPLAVLDEWRMPQEVSRFVGSLGARANPVPGLSLEYRLGFDRYEMESRQSIPRGAPDAPLGSATSANRRNMLLNNDLTGSLDFTAGEAARLTTSVGLNHTYQKVHQFNLSSTDLPPFTHLVRGANQSASAAEIELVTLGFFAQQQMAWDNRIFLTGALRWDASSTFGTDERWQLYPKVSGSWVLSEEGFWQASALGGFFSEMRLRAALGYAGNQPPLGQAYTRVPRYDRTVNVNRLGLVPLGTPGNPQLQPERQREWEAGFDAAVLDDRLSLGFTYYDQYTEDLLLNRPLSPSTGYGSVLDNVGAMSNYGFEVELGSLNVDRPDFSWSSRVIYSSNRNRVEELHVQPFLAGYTNWVEEGYALGVHRMAAFERDEAGNIIEDDIGPVNAGQQIVGNPWPDFTASLLNEFRFRGGWSASILLDGAFGHDLWNQTQRIMDIFQAGPLYDRLLRGEITPEHRSRVQGIWEAYLEDASYVKLRDLTVRYTSDADWVRRIGASQIRLEASARNLITWTDYSGYDPEVNMFGLSTVERGTDFAVYPNPRTFGIGLRLTY